MNATVRGVVAKAAFYLPSPGPINAPQANANFPPPFTASASAYIRGLILLVV